MNCVLTVDSMNQNIALNLLSSMAKSGVEIKETNCFALFQVIFSSEFPPSHKLLSCSILLNKIGEIGFPSKISPAEKQLATTLTPMSSISGSQIKGLLKVIDIGFCFFVFFVLKITKFIQTRLQNLSF